MKPYVICHICTSIDGRILANRWNRTHADPKPSQLFETTAASFGIGGPELPQTANCARRLLELAPFRETGHRILMEALERSGNVAEALRVYDRLRIMLRKELGVAPSPALQDVHRRLRADVDAVLDDLVPRNAQIVSLEIGTTDPRCLLHGHGSPS